MAPGRVRGPHAGYPMAYFMIGSTLVRCSQVAAAAAAPDGGAVLSLKGGGEVYLDRDQADCLRAHLSPSPGSRTSRRRDVQGLGIVLELLHPSSPEAAPRAAGLSYRA